MSGPAPWPEHLPTLTDEWRRGSDSDRLIAQVLATLQRQIEPMLDNQLHAALAPALARAAEMVVHELRQELTRTLHEMVRTAVQRALAEHGDRAL